MKRCLILVFASYSWLLCAMTPQECQRLKAVMEYQIQEVKTYVDDAYWPASNILHDCDHMMEIHAGMTLDSYQNYQYTNTVTSISNSAVSIIGGGNMAKYHVNELVRSMQNFDCNLECDGSGSGTNDTSSCCDELLDGFSTFMEQFMLHKDSVYTQLLSIINSLQYLREDVLMGINAITNSINDFHLDEIIFHDEVMKWTDKMLKALQIQDPVEGVTNLVYVLPYIYTNTYNIALNVTNLWSLLGPNFNQLNNNQGILWRGSYYTVLQDFLFSRKQVSSNQEYSYQNIFESIYDYLSFNPFRYTLEDYPSYYSCILSEEPLFGSYGVLNFALEGLNYSNSSNMYLLGSIYDGLTNYPGFNDGGSVDYTDYLSFVETNDHESVPVFDFQSYNELSWFQRIEVLLQMAALAGNQMLSAQQEDIANMDENLSLTNEISEALADLNAFTNLTNSVVRSWSSLKSRLEDLVDIDLPNNPHFTLQLYTASSDRSDPGIYIQVSSEDSDLISFLNIVRNCFTYIWLLLIGGLFLFVGVQLLKLILCSTIVKTAFTWLWNGLPTRHS